ncbi:sulfotransferase family protein [Thermococcus pacificus]|uniref:Sulfotransferase n=1 Tax=Thermococcus pacificus TaxID=71998 RepID=A0A218P643_9EURY|nr:sulfotransferase [Thermococcus pacificus]ASJ06244.1 sulfotransferase [Thermococcus pacificus]
MRPLLLKTLAKFNMLVDIAASRIHNYSPKDTIAVFGSRRSGSTWLMEILESLPEYRSVFEPFHPRYYPEFGRIGFPYDPYVPLPGEYNRIREYLERSLSGKVYIQFPYRMGVIKRLKGSKLVVKFVRGNTILPWAARTFKIRGYYFIIRHPCATIASQLTTGYHSRITVEQLLNEVNKVPELSENKKLIMHLMGINSEIKRLAAIWAFENYIPLASEKPYPWYTVVYERLIREPEEEFRRVFRYIGEEVPEEAWKKMRKPSMVTRKSYGREYIGTPKQLLKWKDQLSERQVKDILEVVSWFGLDFYDERPEPDYDALARWRP